MESQSLLQLLPLPPLIEIISFLDIPDIFLSLSLTNTKFNETISSSSYIFKTSFENLLGRKIPSTSNFNLNPTQLKQILVTYFSQKQEIPLPYYGFRGNCGCDEDKYEYLFDKIFEPRDGRDPVCTRVGEDFVVEGVLSTDFGKESKQILELVDLFGQLDTPFAQATKEMLKVFRLRALEPFLELVVSQMEVQEQNNALREKIMSLKEERLAFANYSKSLGDKYKLELPCNKMTQAVGLIKSCIVNRETNGVTCPIKTLVAFASMNEEIGLDNPVVSLFNYCKTPADLQKVLYNHKNELPTISQTSLKQFLNTNIKYIDEEEDGVEVVTFHSNGKKSDVIPLFWVRFTKPIAKKLQLNLKDSNLSGRYVMVKLIECENLTNEDPNNEHEGLNIDVHFCSFHGSLLQIPKTDD